MSASDSNLQFIFLTGFHFTECFFLFRSGYDWTCLANRAVMSVPTHLLTVHQLLRPATPGSHQ